MTAQDFLCKAARRGMSVPKLLLTRPPLGYLMTAPNTHPMRDWSALITAMSGGDDHESIFLNGITIHQRSRVVFFCMDVLGSRSGAELGGRLDCGSREGHIGSGHARRNSGNGESRADREGPFCCHG